MPFATISTSASGDTTLVAAQPGRKIRVVSYTVIAAGAVSVKFKSGSTDITGAMALAANGGAAPSGAGLAPSGFAGLFETASGEALVINLSAAVAVGGHLTYQSL